MSLYPSEIKNWVGGVELPAAAGEWFNKLRPHDGSEMCRVARSHETDAAAAVQASRAAQPGWAALTPVRRGEILVEACLALRRHREDVARVVAAETGKSHKSALAETDGAIQLGLFFAGEGQRLFGRTHTSGTPNRYASTVRQPLGVAALVVAANTPIANVAWKTFPALICGNTAVLKVPEDAPVTGWLFGRILHEAGVVGGVINVLQGYGTEVGPPLTGHPDVDVVSFTGSSAVGRRIAAAAGERLARVSLELGGKNPLLVCDDADLDNALKWVLLSAFSNAGQRCTSASRILVFEAVYGRFREMLVEAARALRLGPNDGDDLGPVINDRHLERLLSAVERARERGAVVLCGGSRLTGPGHHAGFYMAPTVIENVDPADELSTCELFGPITCLYRVRDFTHGLQLANDSPYGLTACIHTRNLHRALEFTQKVRAGVAVVNGGTFGSEPHMPFGGFGASGNGTREPGTEALDVYSALKAIYLHVDVAGL